MKLQLYIEKTNLTKSQFAELANIKAPSLSRWLNGSRTPSPEMMLKIYKITKGKVTPNDFILSPTLAYKHSKQKNYTKQNTKKLLSNKRNYLLKTLVCFKEQLSFLKKIYK